MQVEWVVGWVGDGGSWVSIRISIYLSKYVGAGEEALRLSGLGGEDEVGGSWVSIYIVSLYISFNLSVVYVYEST